MNPKCRKEAEEYADALSRCIDDAALRRTLRERKETPSTVYRAGFLAGAAEAHMRLTPRANHMGSILKTLYERLEALTLKYDDLDVLHDLTAMHCLIAGYLVDEGEAILRNTKFQLAKQSGVPLEYIDTDTLITDIPNLTLHRIGLAVANANTRLYAHYVISGCKEDEENVVDFDGLADMARKGLLPAQHIDSALMLKCLVPYGALQVRRVRKAYQQVEKGLAVYKMRHERDATMLTMDVLQKAARIGG